MSYPNYPPNYPGGQPGYPSNQPYPGYPPVPQPGYPPYPNTQPGYPPYPGTQPGYPSSPGFNPPQGYPTPGYPPAVPGYPSTTPGYPSTPGYSAPIPGYPPSNPVPPAGYPGGAYPTPHEQPHQQRQQQHQQHQPHHEDQSNKQQPSHQQQQRLPPVERVIPTVHPMVPFDPRADAEALHKAMKGFGTDEKGLIAVLCNRPTAQRVEITKAYKSAFGKDLESKIKSETSGYFESLLVALCKPRAEYMASEMHHAISGLGTQEGTLIETLLSGDNQEIRDIAVAYKNLYGHSMEKDIKGDTSGTLKMLLVSLAQGNRDENTPVDVAKAREEAQRLYQAGEAKLGTDESTFNAILATRSWAQIRQIMIEYQNLHGNSLENAVASEFSANAEKGLLAILRCAESRPCYFAKRLHKAISGAGTRDRCLIRIVVTHSDIDMGNIKMEYEKLYGRSLASDISNDTSGDYKKGLLALVG